VFTLAGDSEGAQPGLAGSFQAPRSASVRRVYPNLAPALPVSNQGTQAHCLPILRPRATSMVNWCWSQMESTSFLAFGLYLGFNENKACSKMEMASTKF